MSPILSVPKLILDAWPILEWLKAREPCSSSFRALLQDAVADSISLSMSRMNYGEVIYSVRKALPANRVETALSAFHEIPILVHSVDDALVDEAVSLKPAYPVSYADAFATAQAIRAGIPVARGDLEFTALEQIGLRFYWLGT